MNILKLTFSTQKHFASQILRRCESTMIDFSRSQLKWHQLRNDCSRVTAFKWLNKLSLVWIVWPGFLHSTIKIFISKWNRLFKTWLRMKTSRKNSSRLNEDQINLIKVDFQMLWGFQMMKNLLSFWLIALQTNEILMRSIKVSLKRISNELFLKVKGSWRQNL